MTTGRSLELFYIDGRPDGMLTAELFNWTGHVLMAPRTQIAAALKREEAGYAGVYLLLGEEGGEPRAYIGEGEDISARIRSHDVGKEWWTSAVLITAAANKLNKAHVRYLEARLIAEARAIGRVPLDNGTSPAPALLSEADVAKMEAFLENLFIVLPAVRVDMFIHRTRAVSSGSIAQQRSHDGVTAAAEPEPPLRDDQPTFCLESRRHGLHATAILNELGEFVVLAGSSARNQWVGKNYAESSYGLLYRELQREGVIGERAGQYQFLKAYAFRSPSAAASVVTGRSTNGAHEWKHMDTNLSYKDWEANRLTTQFDDIPG